MQSRPEALSWRSTCTSFSIIGTNRLPLNASRTWIKFSMNCRRIDRSDQRSRHHESGTFLTSTFRSLLFPTPSLPPLFDPTALLLRLLSSFGPVLFFELPVDLDMILANSFQPRAPTQSGA